MEFTISFKWIGKLKLVTTTRYWHKSHVIVITFYAHGLENLH